MRLGPIGMILAMASSSLHNDIASLLERAKSGDADAKAELFENYRAYLTYLAKQAIGPKLRRRCDPSDIVQEAYVAAIQSFVSFNGRSEPEFTGWIVKIFQSKLVDVLRRHNAQIRDQGRERELNVSDSSAIVSLFEPVTRDSSPSQCLIRGEQALMLLKALEQLPVDLQSAVRLRYLEGEKLADIAAELQRSPDAVVGLIRRGMAALRQSLVKEILL